MIQTRILQAYTFVLLVIRVIFLFQQKHPDTASLYAHTTEPVLQETTVHNTAPQESTANTDVVWSLAIMDQEEEWEKEPLLADDYIQNQANISVIKQLYDDNPNSELLYALINALLSQHRFVEANNYIQEAVERYPDSLDPYTHIYTVFHSPSLRISQVWSIKVVEELVESYRNRSLISNDDYLFYNAMVQFWYNDFAAARILLQQIQSPKHIDIKNKLLQTFDTLQRQRDIPDYYQDAIVSLTLMKHGYYSIAKKIATHTVIKNDKYILPYQILAHSHFMTQNRDTAIEYLIKLRELESKQAQRYTFLIGVAHYWKGNYSQAIMYLQQVSSQSLIMDAYRYILLSYIQWEEFGKAHSTRQKMLGHSHINKNDFYSYFYHTFYAPMRHGENWHMYMRNQHTAYVTVQQCLSILKTEDHDVCSYGNAWLALANKNKDQAKEILDDLIIRYDEPYLFHALADYYTLNDMTLQAEQYYRKALETSIDSNEQELIKRKIIDL